MKCGSVGSGCALEDGRMMQISGLIPEVVKLRLNVKQLEEMKD